MSDSKNNPAWLNVTKALSSSIDNLEMDDLLTLQEKIKARIAYIKSQKPGWFKRTFTKAG